MTTLTHRFQTESESAESEELADLDEPTTLRDWLEDAELAVPAAAGGAALLAAAAYAAAYLACTRSRVNGFEHRRGRNVGFTVRVFATPALAAFFAPAARCESLLTRRDVTVESPRSIAFDAPFRSPATLGGPRW